MQHRDTIQEMWDVSPVELTAELAQDVTEAAAAVALADGVDPLNEQAHRILAGQLPGLHVAAVDEGSLIGCAQLDTADGSVQLFVVPERRREGVARALAESVRSLVQDPDSLSWWSFGTLPGARAMGAAMGMAPVRSLLQMSLDPQEVPVPDPGPTPDGLVISTFTEADVEDLVETNRLAFAGHPEQGAMTAKDVHDKAAEDWFDPAGLFLARDTATGRLLGFHWTKIVGDVGEVYVIGVHPFEHGRGLGRHLLEVGLAHLRDKGVAEVELFVEGENERVVQMYERAGFREVRRDTSWRA